MRCNNGRAQPTGIDVSKEAVIQGRVLRGGNRWPGAYVRLLDGTGEFTAEVPTSATGHFRFFAGAGTGLCGLWLPGAKADRTVGRGPRQRL